MTKRDLLEALKDVPDDMRLVPIFHGATGMHVVGEVVEAVVGEALGGKIIANISLIEKAKETPAD